MRANPGGVIAPKDVVGRNKLIERLWEILIVQSIILSAERRVGKTSVIRKMCEETPPGIESRARDLENMRTPLEFAEAVYTDVAALLSGSQRTMARFKKTVEHLSGAELGGVKLPSTLAPHWKKLLEDIIADLMQDESRTIVFFWDELPVMLQNIAKSSGDDVAMELLDTLRVLRQTYGDQLRMVFTGSIGLHHVVSSLRDAGHSNPAVNDMRIQEVPPIEISDAEALATMLLTGEGVTCLQPEETAQRIAESADYIPFYIHHIVSMIKDRGVTASPDLVEELVATALVTDQDPWHLEHYEIRVKNYYGVDRAPVVLAILDELAIEECSVDMLHERLKVRRYPESSQVGGQVLDGDREVVLKLLKLLRNDHYIALSSTTSVYAFRFSLIKRWWLTSRNLAC